MYLDGFVAPVPVAQLDAYAAMAKAALTVWQDHGALWAIEAAGDDVPEGVRTSFPRAVDLQDGEVAVFALILFRDRAHRDQVNAPLMADPRMDRGDDTPVFDATRMIWGGFRALVSVGAAPGAAA
jgi:uncharacterized protein YbaA (DUF1428 family)